MEFLIGFLCVVLLLVIFIKLGASTTQIEKLKQRVQSLEQQIETLSKSKEEKPKVKTQPGPGTATPFPVVSGQSDRTVPPLSEIATSHAAKPVSSAQPPVPAKATAKVMSPPPLKKASAPPPLPKPKGKSPVEYLRGMGLWPPEREEGSSELVLMQWWAPRISGGLAILSIIFFAVYVAQGTPPWVKFLEMLVASFGVFGLGLFFSKKRPGLGNVLVATGLSMIYISSVAGYAVGPVKVVDNPIVGALMQIAALVLNFGLGTWKKERSILVLALIFGYVSALFAALEGFREAALISSLLVYLAGIFSYRRIGGLTLMSLSLAGVYLPLVGFVAIELIKDAAVYPYYWSVIAFLALSVSILPSCKILLNEPGFLDAGWNRLYQSLNTSIALGLGFLFVSHFYPLGKTEFYGVLAIVFLAWSLLWFFKDLNGIEFHLFFLKGSALASLWFINYYHGDLRWMALGIQVVILAASVHRSRSVWIEVITLITWLFSFRYFLETNFYQPVGSFLWFVQGAYLLVSVAGLGYLMGYTETGKRARRVVYTFPSLLLFGATVGFAVESRVNGLDEPGVIAIMSLLILLVSILPVVRAWVPVVTGGLVFLAANIAFWIEPSGLYTLLVVLAVSAIFLAGLLKTDLPKRDLVETILHGFWVITALYYLKTYQSYALYPILIAVFSSLLFLGGYSPFKRLPEVCVFPLLFIVLFPPPGEYPTAILFLFALLVGCLANVGVVFPRFKKFVYFLKQGDLLWWLLNALFLFWAGWVFGHTVSLTNQLLLWVGLGAIYMVIWYARARVVSFVALLICASVPVARVVDLWLNPTSGGFINGAPWAAQVLLAGIASMALWVLIGGYTKLKPHPMLNEKSQVILAWASGLIAYLVYAAAFDYPLLNWERLYTPLLAAFSIGLIVLGIVLKSKPYRFVAMLTFTIPLFRLFVFDIRETLYRIIAFAVLGVVGFVVAFLYQKFSSRIE